MLRYCKSGDLEELKKWGCPTRPDEIACAALNGHLDIVKYLAEIGSPADTQVIKYAIKNGNLEILKYLMNKVYSRPYIDKIAIEYAIKDGQLDIVKYLVSTGAPVDEYAVSWAIGNRHLEIAKFLIENVKSECSEYIGPDITSIIINYCFPLKWVLKN